MVKIVSIIKNLESHSSYFLIQQKEKENNCLLIHALLEKKHV